MKKNKIVKVPKVICADGVPLNYGDLVMDLGQRLAKVLSLEPNKKGEILLLYYSIFSEGTDRNDPAELKLIFPAGTSISDVAEDMGDHWAFPGGGTVPKTGNAGYGRTKYKVKKVLSRREEVALANWDTGDTTQLLGFSTALEKYFLRPSNK